MTKKQQGVVARTASNSTRTAIELRYTCNCNAKQCRGHRVLHNAPHLEYKKADRPKFET